MSEHDHRRQKFPPKTQHSNDGQQGHGQAGHTQGHGGGGAKGFDLAQSALDEMHAAGFKPEFGAGVAEQMAAIEAKFAVVAPTAGVEDLRGLGWSSIDNDTSKDLDQIEVAERVARGGRRDSVARGDWRCCGRCRAGQSHRQTCAGRRPRRFIPR